MFSIGEFSRLCQVTTKTLRHYDAIGLLKPAFLNEENGYRYYEAHQLRDMMFILRFREYGFSLDEIAGLCGARETGMLESMRAKLRQQYRELGEKNRLIAQMERDIAKMEKGMDIMKQNIEVKMVQRQPVDIISVKDTIAMKDFDKLFDKLMGVVRQSGAQVTGAPIAIYHDHEFDVNSAEVELAFPTGTKSAATRTLDGGKCATAVHRGAYAKLHDTYTAIGEWLDENGCSIRCAPYEIYRNNPGDAPEEELLTEIYFPVK